jgi:hypothetical protein
VLLGFAMQFAAIGQALLQEVFEDVELSLDEETVAEAIH